MCWGHHPGVVNPPQVLASIAPVREPRADTILGLLLVQPLAKPLLAQQCRLCPASAHHLFQIANAVTTSYFGEATAKYFGFLSSFCASLRHLSSCYSQPTLEKKKKKSRTIITLDIKSIFIKG